MSEKEAFQNIDAPEIVAYFSVNTTVACHFMKTLHFILLLFFAATCFANDIDRLQSNGDVSNFLIRKVDKKYKKYPPLDINPKVVDTSRYQRNKFFKVDIDNNGLTDLIIYGYRTLFTVLDSGKNNYSVHYLDRGTFLSNTATLISIDTSSAPTKILIKQSEKPENLVDTLIYKFNYFIEYNSTPIVDFNFEGISFKTNQCFGTCPMFEITVNKDRTATYKAVKYNDETGFFKATIPQKEFDELILLLRYISLDKVSYSYAVNWTDDQTAFTEIKYNNKTKSIVDYGQIGTFGLSILYSKFFNWRKSIEWTE
jgi:hypothetical protein